VRRYIHDHDDVWVEQNIGADELVLLDVQQHLLAELQLHLGQQEMK
jgi:hypothetical protein